MEKNDASWLFYFSSFLAKIDPKGGKMKCPFCNHDITPETKNYFLRKDSDGYWFILFHQCPNEDCKKFFLELANSLEPAGTAGNVFPVRIDNRFLIFPRKATREMAKPEVPKEIADDFNEAIMVLNDSPKASAALGRRCLQNLLREKAGVKHGNLTEEIEEILNRKELPSHLANGLDAVRQIGNFAAHPIKSEKSGEIVPIEPGEAEWILDILEGLFDFYFVQPEIIKQKKEKLNKKLEEAGKPKLK